ncbi:uncharacterized protein BDV14DRAFT_201870 [Aspergillus stella-maris]|uniref:uncharacterized protein n=1 Tax=Aspergillus stella-maris TaxID=1810926 RepID=UPI003CCD01A3
MTGPVVKKNCTIYQLSCADCQENFDTLYKNGRPSHHLRYHKSTYPLIFRRIITVEIDDSAPQLSVENLFPELKVIERNVKKYLQKKLRRDFKFFKEVIVAVYCEVHFVTEGNQLPICPVVVVDLPFKIDPSEDLGQVVVPNFRVHMGYAFRDEDDKISRKKLIFGFFYSDWEAVHPLPEEEDLCLARMTFFLEMDGIGRSQWR